MLTDTVKLGACILGHQIYVSSRKTCQVYNMVKNKWNYSFALPCDCYAMTMVPVKMRYIYGVA